jgi:hypothetical protein
MIITLMFAMEEVKLLPAGDSGAVPPKKIENCLKCVFKLIY